MRLGPDHPSRPLEAAWSSDTGPRPRPRHAGPIEVPDVSVMPRSLDQLIARGDELADKFKAYETREADRALPTLMACVASLSAFPDRTRVGRRGSQRSQSWGFLATIGRELWDTYGSDNSLPHLSRRLRSN